MRLPVKYSSRRLWSLFTVRMSTVISPAVTRVSAVRTEPVTSGVRPTASIRCPVSTSLTRYPASEPGPTL